VAALSPASRCTSKKRGAAFSDGDLVSR
jgi:hypothetical protein